MRIIHVRDWVRDHLVASLLIVAGLGAVGQYAIGNFLTGPTMDRTALAKNSRDGTRALGRAAQGLVDADQAMIDSALLDIEDAVAKGVDPELSPLLEQIAVNLREWRRYFQGSQTTTRPAKLEPLLAKAEEVHSRLKTKYGDHYR